MDKSINCKTKSRKSSGESEQNSNISAELNTADDFHNDTYPVVWAGLKQGNKPINYVGICGKTWKPCFFTRNIIHALIVKDLYVGSNGCQDENHCSNISCPLNKTTPESLATAKNFGASDKKWLIKNWQWFTRKFSENKAEVAELCKKAYLENGIGGVIWLNWKPINKDKKGRTVSQ